MPTNNNTDITKKMRDGMLIEQAVDEVPTKIASSIVPVFLVNDTALSEISIAPQNVKVIALAAAGNFLTTSATKRTFVTAISMSWGSRNQDSILAESITLTPLGMAPLVVLKTYGGVGAAGVKGATISQDFTTPIEVDKGSVISFAAAAFDEADANLFYYEIDA